ncbi:MAG: endonuclease/exonuclease/phosphatase family protein [Bacteroidetes bacterium]|nr:MAG: endonuclease/exonuclease/phosphatase family protein [Bacteroidota bacterium]
MLKTSVAGKILKMVLRVIILLIAGLLSFFIWQTITEFDPDPASELEIIGNATELKDTLTLTTYNIGYCGLGAEMDFFYEGGTMVRPEKELYDRYLGEVMQRLDNFSGSDFILLQEVDTMAKRSWYANQFRLIRNKFTGHQTFFAMNYKAWVPMPVMQPMGKVRAGIVTIGKAIPADAVRYAFNSGYSWPMSLFMLKRCYLLTRYNTGNGKQLVLVNTHNSAFGDAAEIRGKELSQLKEMMTTEYAKGNYVIIGGDWNQNPAIFDSTAVQDNYLVKSIRPPVPADFLPEGWQYAWDPLHPTNRDVDIPYQEGRTKTTLIDFFVLSPNVGLVSATTTPTGFKESDHQPVSVKVFLKK